MVLVGKYELIMLEVIFLCVWNICVYFFYARF